MNVLVTLLKSKRTWVMVLTLSFHFLAKYHVILSDSDVSDIADQIVLAVGALGVVGTKIADSKNEAANCARLADGNSQK